MSSDIAIKVNNLSKCYAIYERPQDRLKQMVLGKLSSLTGQARKQYYREFWALKDISFEVKKGQTVGIIGRNGSGKSTLLQMICGTLNPTSGSVTTHGRVAALLELGSGFNPEFTGRENVYLNATVLGLNRSEIEHKFTAIQAFADIGEFIDQPVRTYSSGMQLRLAFAVIAHVDADILVIDEALAVGDAFFTQKCMRFLRDFMQNKTVLFVSHDTGAIANLCQHVIWLHNGSVCLSGPPEAVSKSYLAARYGQVPIYHSGTHLVSTAVQENLTSTYEDQIDSWRAQSSVMGYSNLISVFKFNTTSNSFGAGGAEITDVKLFDDSGQTIDQVKGGDYVTLSIQIEVQKEIEKPIIGFFVKDRLGQILFGENTYVAYKDNGLLLTPQKDARALFAFRMPILPLGTYMVDAAIASGDDLDHTQLQWKHDVLIIESISTSISTGLVGVSMRSISIVSN